MAVNGSKVEKWVKIISTSEDVIESVLNDKPAWDIATDKAQEFVTDFALGLGMVAVLPTRLVSPVALLCSVLSPTQMGNGSLPQDISDIFKARNLKMPSVRKIPQSILTPPVKFIDHSIVKPVEHVVVKPVVQIIKPVTKPVQQAVSQAIVKPVDKIVVQPVVQPVVHTATHSVKRLGKHLRKMKF